MLIRDCMAPTWNPVNGKYYDSKRAYEKAVKAKGSHIIERGEKVGTPPALPDPVHDVIAAVEQVASRSSAPKRKRRK